MHFIKRQQQWNIGTSYPGLISVICHQYMLYIIKIIFRPQQSFKCRFYLHYNPTQPLPVNQLSRCKSILSRKKKKKKNRLRTKQLKVIPGMIISTDDWSHDTNPPLLKLPSNVENLVEYMVHKPDCSSEWSTNRTVNIYHRLMYGKVLLHIDVQYEWGQFILSRMFKNVITL